MTFAVLIAELQGRDEDSRRFPIMTTSLIAITEVKWTILCKTKCKKKIKIIKEKKKINEKKNVLWMVPENSNWKRLLII